MASRKGVRVRIAEDPPPGAMNSISAVVTSRIVIAVMIPRGVPLGVVSLFCRQRDSLDRKERTKFRTSPPRTPAYPVGN